MLPHSFHHPSMMYTNTVYSDNVRNSVESLFLHFHQWAGEFPTRLPRRLNQGRVLPPAIGGLGALRLAMSCRLQGFWSKNWSNQKRMVGFCRIVSPFHPFFTEIHQRSHFRVVVHPFLWDGTLYCLPIKKKARGSWAAFFSTFLSQLPTLEESKPHQHWASRIYPAAPGVSEIPNKIRQ